MYYSGIAHIDIEKGHQGPVLPPNQINLLSQRKRPIVHYHEKGGNCEIAENNIRVDGWPPTGII
jgi:hypothetical protein